MHYEFSPTHHVFLIEIDINSECTVLTTDLDAVRYKSSIPAVPYLLFEMLPGKMVCVSFHTLHCTS